MSSSPCRSAGDAVRRTWPTHGLGKWEVPAGDKFSREVIRKVKHYSVRIENPLLALYRGTGYFSLARTFRTVWGARTPETVGGPNGAQRSEFRRTAPPDNNDIVLSQCFPAMSYVSVVGHATCPARGILQSSGRGEFLQSGRRHGPLCNTLIIMYHLF